MEKVYIKKTRKHAHGHVIETTIIITVQSDRYV